MVHIILGPLSQLKVTIYANKFENYFIRSFLPQNLKCFQNKPCKKFNFWGKSCPAYAFQIMLIIYTSCTTKSLTDNLP